MECEDGGDEQKTDKNGGVVWWRTGSKRGCSAIGGWKDGWIPKSEVVYGVTLCRKINSCRRFERWLAVPFIFGVKQSSHVLQDRGTVILRNVGSYLPNDEL